MTAGRVRVNGVVATELGTKVDPLIDRVTVDDVEVRLANQCVYLMLHKPRGVVTTMSDPQRRPTVASLVPVAEHPGLFPVGRLDFDTTGLLLFTTDGELAHRVLHPRRKVMKTYLALVDRIPDESNIRSLSEGIDLDDGRTAPADVALIERRGETALMRIAISEGRKRQVRRMFSYLAHPVIELHRIAFGPIELGALPEGTWRHLTAEEIAALRDAVGDATGDATPAETVGGA